MDLEHLTNLNRYILLVALMLWILKLLSKLAQSCILSQLCHNALWDICVIFHVVNWKRSMYERILSIKTEFMELLYLILLFSVCSFFINVHFFGRMKNRVKVHEGYSEVITTVNEALWNDFFYYWLAKKKKKY